jgi:predicted RNA-binding protein with TRAM domain
MQSSTPLCLFTGRVEQRDGAYVLTVPEHEVDLGTLEPSETYRFGVYTAGSSKREADGAHQESTEGTRERHTERQTAPRARRRDTSQTAATPEGTDSSPNTHTDQPPVAEGETLQVEIEGLGEQGDGLAKVGPGYVVFVSDTEIGQQPVVRITAARDTVAFAEVVEE